MDEQTNKQDSSLRQPSLEDTEKSSSIIPILIMILVPLIVLILILAGIYFLYNPSNEDTILPDSIKVEDIISSEQVSREVGNTVSSVIPESKFEINVISDIYENPFNAGG